MKRIILFLLFLLTGWQVRAQETSLAGLRTHDFLQWLRLYRHPTARKSLTLFTEEKIQKCGFSITSEILRRMPEFSPMQKEELWSIFAPPARDTSILSPSGRFRIHYDTSDINEPALLDSKGNRIPNTEFAYAQEVAKAFDHVYTIEVDSLGYLPAPMQFNAKEYQVYILDEGVYGETMIDIPYPCNAATQCHASYIQIDNDFTTYFTKGLPAMRVTAAHEYHHAIQLGRYGHWTMDSQHYFIHELSSTWMEDFIYPTVNDYRLYLDKLFSSPDIPFFRREGYELVLWGKLLEIKYSPLMLRSTWEEIRKVEPLTASNRALITAQSNFTSEFCSFALWNYFTSFRAVDSTYYPDAREYPRVLPKQSMELLNGMATCSDQLAPLSTHYIKIYKGIDTATFIISNIDFSRAVNRDQSRTSYTLEIRQQGSDASFSKLSNGWGYKFTSTDPNSFCLKVLVSDIQSVPNVASLYPNPFDPSRADYLFFTLPPTVSQKKVQLNIYTVSMDQISQTDEVVMREGGLTFIKWNGDVRTGEKIKSGVYFYSVVFGEEINIGKFVVLNR